MELVNEKQRESLAKFLYDSAKILFGTLVVGNLAFRQFFDSLAFWFGTIGTISAVIIALTLEGVKKGRRRK